MTCDRTVLIDFVERTATGVYSVGAIASVIVHFITIIIKGNTPTIVGLIATLFVFILLFTDGIRLRIFTQSTNDGKITVRKTLLLSDKEQQIYLNDIDSVEDFGLCSRLANEYSIPIPKKFRKKLIKYSEGSRQRYIQISESFYENIETDIVASKI